MKVFEYQGVSFYLGKTATENWELLDKAKAEDPNYIWFHLESFPSSYVIMWSSIKNLEELIKTEEKELKDSLAGDENNNIKLASARRYALDQFLSFGANLCKENSKYKDMKHVKIMYTTVKKLTKTDKVGEVNVKGKYLTLL